MDAKRPVFILEALGKALSKTIHSSGFRGGILSRKSVFKGCYWEKKNISLWKVLTGLCARRMLTSWTGELDPHLMASYQVKFKQHSKGLKLV